MKYIIILFFFISLNVNAQNDLNIPDSLVRNSAAFYSNWLSIYNKMKDDKIFQVKMQSNIILKYEFDSATSFRGQYSKAIKLTMLSSFVPMITLFFIGNKSDPIPSNFLAITPIIPTLIHLADRRNRRFLTSEFVRHVYNAASLSGFEIKKYNWDVKAYHTLDYIKFHKNEIYIKHRIFY
jgi:hypothetical protein